MFKVRDRIRFTTEAAKKYGAAYGVNHVVHSVEKSFPTGKFIIYVEGGKWAFYSEHFELQEPETPESKHKGLCTKITQLYERQEWVQSGKPEATFSTRPPAPSVGSKDGTGGETTSESSPMVTPIASPAVTRSEASLEEIMDRYRRLYHNPMSGLSLSQINPISGFGRTTSR